MWRFNELLKRTQMLVNSFRDGEPSCPALELEVTDLILYPDRERDKEKATKSVTDHNVVCVSWLVRNKGQTKALKILLFSLFTHKILYMSCGLAFSQALIEEKEVASESENMVSTARSHGGMAH